MSIPPFQFIEACVFDAYGTLFDIHSAVGKHRARLGEAADGLPAVPAAELLTLSELPGLLGY